MYRIGFSKDIHPLKENRPLILGGIHIPYHLGLDGHSDADVVIHAISEAILGALAIGDLGTHFPDNDDKYKNIDSTILLKEVVKLMENNHYEINNIDVQIGLSKPKLKDYKEAMRNNIASLLKTNIENVSIKAMTYNSLGDIGNNNAAEAYCIVMLRSK